MNLTAVIPIMHRFLTCPTVTRAPLLDAIVAPENSFLVPSERKACLERETFKRADVHDCKRCALPSRQTLKSPSSACL